MKVLQLMAFGFVVSVASLQSAELDLGPKLLPDAEVTRFEDAAVIKYTAEEEFDPPRGNKTSRVTRCTTMKGSRVIQCIQLSFGPGVQSPQRTVTNDYFTLLQSRWEENVGRRQQAEKVKQQLIDSLLQYTPVDIAELVTKFDEFLVKYAG